MVLIDTLLKQINFSCYNPSGRGGCQIPPPPPACYRFLYTGDDYTSKIELKIFGKKTSKFDLIL